MRRHFDRNHAPFLSNPATPGRNNSEPESQVTSPRCVRLMTSAHSLQIGRQVSWDLVPESFGDPKSRAPARVHHFTSVFFFAV